MNCASLEENNILIWIYSQTFENVIFFVLGICNFYLGRLPPSPRSILFLFFFLQYAAIVLNM